MSNRVAAALILCVFAIGCRTDPNRALRERELRLMEDRIYQLEECVREYQAALAVSERDNAQLRCGCAGPPLTDDNASSGSRSHIPQAAPSDRTQGSQGYDDRHGSNARAPSSAGAPSNVSAPPNASGPPLERTLPAMDVETGAPSSRFSSPRDPATEKESIRPQRSPESQLPSRPDQTRGMIPPRGTHVGADAGSGQIETPATESDSKVKRVALAKLATGGYDAEPETGDEGVTLILRPLDSDGNLVRAAAPIAVVVMDPELPGDAARVARWDFSVDEVARSFRRSGLSEGIHLNMRWPAAPPSHPDLMLFVRYTTRDGRHLETHQTIRIDPPDPNAPREGPGSHESESTRNEPPVDHPLDTPRRVVPDELPASDVARRARPEPRVATKPNRSVPQWSPTR